MFPDGTQFDEVAKRITDLGEGPLLLWLADYSPSQIGFVRFLPTELTLPGTTQRICDALAHLVDHTQGGIPLGGIVEFQTEPDFDMFDRLGLAGHLLRLTRRPSEHPGDRWSLVGIVINLTGNPNSSRTMKHAGSEWTIQCRERNLQELDASVVLEGIARGEIPMSVSAFISLMKKGGELVTIQRWLEVTAAFDVSLRREFAGACVVFAELTDCQEQWLSAVKGLDMIRSKFLTQIEEQGRQEGNAQGTAKAVLRLLRRYATVPSDLEHAILGSSDQSKLDAALDFASDRLPLNEFRQQTGL